MTTTKSSLKVVAFAGSVRRESLNRLLLRSAIYLAPDGMVIEELDISDQMDEPGASDYIGLLMESDTTSILVFGLRIKYS